MARTPRSPAKKPAPEAAAKVEPATKVARRPRLPWLIAAVAALGVGLLISAKLTGLIPGEPAQDPAAAAIEQRFTALEQRLTAIETRLDTAADATDDAAARVDSLDGRLADIEARPPVVPRAVDLAPLEDRLAALEEAHEARGKEAAGGGGAAADLADRIAALEARPSIRDAGPPPAATLLAVAQLRGALRGSGPFDASLAALEALGGTGDEADGDGGIAASLAVLTPHAATGIATLEKLRDRFTPLAEAILRAVVAPPGDSWIGRTLARLSGLVAVRRVGGDVAGDTVEAIVARAEARLGVGDLAAAVAEVAALDGAPAEVAASWLADARARLAAEAALAALDARAIAAMGGG